MLRRWGSLPFWRRLCWNEGGAVTARGRDGRGLCSSTRGSSDKAPETAASVEEVGMTRAEAYRRIHDLDFMTAARILFTAPPQKKKFGLDFHLVQLFFACMPSLAVYLVAQYARYEIRRMEAEVELKKKAEEEEKSKQAEEEAEAKQMEVTGIEPHPELAKVKHRLDALEEAVQEIAVETKKISRGNLTKSQRDEKKETVPAAGGDSSSQDKPNAKEYVEPPSKEMGDVSDPSSSPISPQNVKSQQG